MRSKYTNLVRMLFLFTKHHTQDRHIIHDRAHRIRIYNVCFRVLFMLFCVRQRRSIPDSRNTTACYRYICNEIDINSHFAISIHSSIYYYIFTCAYSIHIYLSLFAGTTRSHHRYKSSANRFVAAIRMHEHYIELRHIRSHRTHRIQYME